MRKSLCENHVYLDAKSSILCLIQGQEMFPPLRLVTDSLTLVGVGDDVLIPVTLRMAAIVGGILWIFE